MYEIDEQKVFLQGEHPTHIHSTCTTLSQENATDIQIAVTRITVRIITHLVAFKKIHGTVSEMKTGQNCCKESEMSGMKTSHSVQSWFVVKVATIGTHSQTCQQSMTSHPKKLHSSNKNESFIYRAACSLPILFFPHPLSYPCKCSDLMYRYCLPVSQNTSAAKHHALAQDFLNCFSGLKAPAQTVWLTVWLQPSPVFSLIKWLSLKWKSQPRNKIPSVVLLI